MTEMHEHNGASFTWKKGATYWGEPLPFLLEEEGKAYVVYGDWWTDKRIERLSAWSSDALRHLRAVLGNDRHLEIRARAKVFMASAGRWKSEAGTNMNMTGLFANWHPDEAEKAKIAELVAGYQKTREMMRAELEACRGKYSEIAEDLPEDRSSWNELNMAFAVLRLPRLIDLLVRLGELPAPTGIVPENATVSL